MTTTARRALRDMVIVSAEIEVVNSAVLASLRELRHTYGRVVISPRVKSASSVPLSDVRYILSQIEFVDDVLDLDVASPLLNGYFVELPSSLDSRGQLGEVPVDDPVPRTVTVRELCNRGQRTLVLLTGCFDLIHAGHVALIEKACVYGVPPVIACLTTEAIRRQPKNRNRRRPLWSMTERLFFLQSLRFKPEVLFFDGPDSLGLIEQLRPDVFVKAKRDQGREIVRQEAALVASYGGKVVWEETRFDSSSTTAIAETILGPGA